MREITAYQCPDGSLHQSEAKAKAHEEDLLGQELDGLLRLFELDITRNQEYRAIMAVMKKRAELAEAVGAILRILKHSAEAED